MSGPELIQLPAEVLTVEPLRPFHVVRRYLEVHDSVHDDCSRRVSGTCGTRSANGFSRQGPSPGSRSPPEDAANAPADRAQHALDRALGALFQVALVHRAEPGRNVVAVLE